MRERFMDKFIFHCGAMICLCLGLATPLTPTPAHAGSVVLACPDLAQAVQLGACPTDKELRATYRKTCPTFLEKDGECKPFEAFARTKNKALWGAMSGAEEFLSYLSCAQPAALVKSSKPISVTTKCNLQSGRCEARCGYENAITFNLRVKGSCKTATGQKIDCAKDPKACVATCELFED